MKELLDWLNAERGRRSMLALRLDVVPSAITHWVRRGEVPFWQVKNVERITGIPRWELRPDIYEKMEVSKDGENGERVAEGARERAD